MKRPILLVNLSIAEVSTTNFFVMPIGILSIASYLTKNNFAVKFIDFNVIKRNNKIATDDELLKIFAVMVREIDPSLVGFSVMVAGQFNLANAAAKIAKQNVSNVKTVVGGAHVTQFPNEILKNCPDIDIVVLGEGENQSLALTELSQNNIWSEKFPNGLAYRSNGQIIVNSNNSFINNLNNLPFPAYELLNFEDYRHDTSTWHNPFKTDLGVRVPLITSRGCPNLCTFCSVGNSMGLCYRPMNANRVVDLIQRLYEENAVRTFVIYDANFTQRSKRVIDICNEIINRNLKINIDLPTGLPLKKDSIELIDALVEAGLIRTCVSVESGDTYIRNEVMKKSIDEEEMIMTIDRIRKYPQVFLMTDFVMGMPEDTAESLEASVKLIEGLDVDDIDLTISTPYPGTALFEQCEKDGLFFSDIDKDKLYCSSKYCHNNRNMFIIKPYNMDYESLCHYRDKILSLRKQKIKSYHTRMRDIFNVDSNYRKNLLLSESL
jgi:anaerobic magnesium-protoporphyrin IX monomethyl ester cyclase